MLVVKFVLISSIFAFVSLDGFFFGDSKRKLKIRDTKWKFYSNNSAVFVFPLFTPQASDFVEGKFMVDDMSAVGNPDYLTISAGIDKSGVEPIANVYADLIKDVNEIKVKVSLSAEVSGEFKEIYKSKDFNPCKDEEVEDVRQR